MKGHTIYGLRVTCVVLYEFVGANVPYFDGGIGAARCNERAARMKGHTVHVARILIERVHALFRVSIPQFEGFVVGRAYN